VRVKVINTGTELLLGDVVNTHLAFLAQELFPLGLRIERQIAIPDGRIILHELLESLDRCDILIITGGLGPTDDDVTCSMTAEALGLRVVLDEAVLASLQERCKRRGISLLDSMKRQAYVPEGCIVMPNRNGTAPGIYLPPVRTVALASPHIFLLPGPPRELRPMVHNQMIPILEHALPGLEHSDFRNYRITGTGESAVQERIGSRLSEEEGIEVGYCARPNEVDFRIIGPPEKIERIDAEVHAELGDIIFSTEGESLEAVVVRMLNEAGSRLTTVESCTGGLLANRVTDVPGASEPFVGGFVTYSNELKQSLVKVPAVLLEEHGAVSKPVAAAMAEGALEVTGADYALSTTGIAGPGGGTEQKPVGTVFIGLAQRGAETTVLPLRYNVDRPTFKQLTTQYALDLLRKRLLENSQAEAQYGK